MSVVILRGCENIQSGPRWWSLRCEIKERGGGDAVASVTTSDAEIAAQPPPARRVTGGAPSSASPPLLNDGPASPASRRLASDGAAPVTRAALDFFTASELAQRRSRGAQRRTPSRVSRKGSFLHFGASRLRQLRACEEFSSVPSPRRNDGERGAGMRGQCRAMSGNVTCSSRISPHPVPLFPLRGARGPTLHAHSG